MAPPWTDYFHLSLNIQVKLSVLLRERPPAPPEGAKIFLPEMCYHLREVMSPVLEAGFPPEDAPFILKALKSKQKALKFVLRALKSKQKALKFVLRALNSEQKALKFVLRALNSEQKALKSQLRALNPEQKALKLELRALNSKQKALNMELKALKLQF